jgi:hypothetical protein
MAVFIIRAMFGDEFPYPAEPYFSDVTPSDWYFPYVQKLRERGITLGCSDGRFCTGTASGGEVVALLVRAAVGDSFSIRQSRGYSTSEPFYRYLQKGLELGINGRCTVAGDFDCFQGYPYVIPGVAATREQVATLVMRALLGEQLP